MDVELINLPTGTLLEKFGLGSHVPGSGSAAALQGMLSAQLISTVINLTNGRETDNYKLILPRLKGISSEITKRIYPRLQDLFQQDSEQFDAAIKLRQARDNERKFKKRKELDWQSQEALKAATETLVQIAKLSVELGGFATFIFEKAFKSARGDSGVALNGAIAAVAGCLSIINLNFISIKDREWIEKIKIDTMLLKVDLEKLLETAKGSLIALESEVEINQLLQDEIGRLKDVKFRNVKISDRNIETVAKDVQNILWRYRNTIWKAKKIEYPWEVLKPSVAIEKLMGYKIVKRDSLGLYSMYGDSVEVAGVIDNDNMAIGISKKFPHEVQNFTLAHELGHALLHQQTGLHRDKAIGNSVEFRDPIEVQADRFATFFLMPKKQVEEYFMQIFSMKKFTLNEDNVFALTGDSLHSFRSKCRNLRELSRIISSTQSFQGKPCVSIAEIFHVSIEAMAIRLEELGLVELDLKTSKSFSS